jgi:hypothetical protein
MSSLVIHYTMTLKWKNTKSIAFEGYVAGARETP